VGGGEVAAGSRVNDGGGLLGWVVTSGKGRGGGGGGGRVVIQQGVLSLFL